MTNIPPIACDCYFSLPLFLSLNKATRKKWIHHEIIGVTVVLNSNTNS